MVGSDDVHRGICRRNAGADQQETGWFKSIIALLLLIPFGAAFLFILIAVKIGEIYDWTKRRKNPKAQ